MIIGLGILFGFLRSSPYRLNPSWVIFTVLNSWFPKGLKFYSFMNRSSVKFSYSPMSNMGAIIMTSNRAKSVRYHTVGSEDSSDSGGCH